MMVNHQNFQGFRQSVLLTVAMLLLYMEEMQV
jgi:hypothetical protein